MTLFHRVKKMKTIMLPIYSFLKKCSQVEFIAEQFVRRLFITIEKKMFRARDEESLCICF